MQTQAEQFWLDNHNDPEWSDIEWCLLDLIEDGLLDYREGKLQTTASGNLYLMEAKGSA